jgi:hypothetical protein
MAVGRTNVIAIFALVASILFAPAGIVLGLFAHRQIKRTGERGQGLATAGVAIGGILVALWLISMLSYA